MEGLEMVSVEMTMNKLSIYAFVVLGGGGEYFENLFFLTLCFRYNCLPYCVDYL